MRKTIAALLVVVFCVTPSSAHMMIHCTVRGPNGARYQLQSADATRTRFLAGTYGSTGFKTAFDSVDGYYGHGATVRVTATFTAPDGELLANCPPVDAPVYEPFPGTSAVGPQYHYLTRCRPVFVVSGLPGGYSCASDCIVGDLPGLMPDVPAEKGIWAFPNPFVQSRGHETIWFVNLPQNGRVRIYARAGRLVREFTADANGHGRWNGDNQGGHPVGSGIYTIVAEGKKAVRVVVQR